MKRIILTAFLWAGMASALFAQNDPDRIVGVYLATYEGE